MVLSLYMVLGFVLYAESIQTTLLSDDWARLQSPWSLVQPTANFLRPVVNLYFSLGFLFFKTNAAGYHFVLVALHALNAFILYLVSRHLYNHHAGSLKNHGFYLSGLTGLVFLSLARHSEAVCWLSGSTDVLACLFVFLSFLFYLKSRLQDKLFYLILSLISFMLGLLSKEAAAFLPFLILLYEILVPRGDRPRARSRRFAPALHFAALGIYVMFRFIYLGGIGGYDGVHTSFDFPRILKTTIPYHLSSVLPRAALSKMWLISADASVVILIAFLAVMTILALAAFSKRDSDLSVGAKTALMMKAGFFFSLAPVITLPVGFLTFQGERFSYIPSLILSFLLVFISGLLFRRFKFRLLAVAGLALLVASLNAASLLERNLTWKSSADIARRILDQSSEIVGKQNVKSILFLTFPDSIDDAYCFRNGLLPALKMRLGEEYEIVTGVAHHISHPLRRISIKPRILSSQERLLFEIRTNSLFFAAREIQTDRFKLRPQSENTLELEIDESQPLLVLFFSEGKVRTLRLQEP